MDVGKGREQGAEALLLFAGAAMRHRRALS